MTLTKVALCSLRRRRAKALLLSLGIAIGVGTVVALHLLSVGIESEIGDQLDRYGANILVLPQSRTLALDYGGLAAPGITYDQHALSTDDVARIAEIPYRERLSAVAPKLIGTTRAEGRDVVIAGVDFANELRLRRWWQLDGRKPTGANHNDVLLGFEVAQMLGVISRQPQVVNVTQHAGLQHGNVQESTITLLRESVEVGGKTWQAAAVIGRTGGPEDHMVFASLTAVQQVLGKKGRVDVVEISALCKGCPVEDIVAQIQAKVPHAKVSAIQQAVRMREEMVQRLTRFSYVVSIVVLVIGSLLVLTTMTSSVVERTREIGVLRAMGYRRVHVMRVLATEVVVVGLIGGFAGWFIGVGTSWAALPFFTENGARPVLDPVLLLVAASAAVLLALLASLQPMLKASRLDPTEALRAL